MVPGTLRSVWWVAAGVVAVAVGGAGWVLDRLARINRQLLPGDPYAELGARPPGWPPVRPLRNRGPHQEHVEDSDEKGTGTGG